jgi:hypothetical protein
MYTTLLQSTFFVAASSVLNLRALANLKHLINWRQCAHDKIETRLTHFENLSAPDVNEGKAGDDENEVGKKSN